MIHIQVITGQTATGKTKKALDLAKKMNGEIINVDSRQIYKHLDVTTGKDLEITDGEFHLFDTVDSFDLGYYHIRDTDTKLWLYDIVSPKQNFSAFDYRKCALLVIDEIISRGKTPILVGGTYFYLKTLLYGTIQTPVEPDESLRATLNTLPVTELQATLAAENPEVFQTLNDSDRHNPHRLIRKIEISRAKVTEKLTHDPLITLFPHLEIQLNGYFFKSKEDLIKTITERVEERLESGAIFEMQTLLARGFSIEDPGLCTIGYQEINAYLEKKYSYEEMKQLWITKEVQYAKRQKTFTKQNDAILWHPVERK